MALQDRIREYADIEIEGRKAFYAKQNLDSNPYWPTEWQWEVWRKAWLVAAKRNA